MVRVMALLGAIAVALTFTGCATVTSGTTQAVTFTSDPIGANVAIASKKNDRHYSTTTPGTVELPRKYSYDATFTKAGFEPLTVSVDRKAGAATAGSTAGNLLLLGGIFGVIVDSATGANANLPKNVNAKLLEIAAAPILLTDAPPPVELLAPLETITISGPAEPAPSVEVVASSPTTTILAAAIPVEPAPVIAPPAPPLIAEITTASVTVDGHSFVSWEYASASTGAFPVRLSISQSHIDDTLKRGEKNIHKIPAGPCVVSIADTASGKNSRPDWSTQDIELNLDGQSLTRIVVMTNPKDDERVVTVTVLQDERVMQRRFIAVDK